MTPLAFLATRSFKNAVRKRLARFGDPKYLIGTLVFVAYLSFMVLPALFRPPRPVVTADEARQKLDVAEKALAEAESKKDSPEGARAEAQAREKLEEAKIAQARAQNPVSHWFDGATAVAIATGLLIMGVLSGWIFSDRSPLAFSMAEASFLFTAPISRASLLRSKILKSQLVIGFSALVALYARRTVQDLRGPSVLVGALMAFELVYLNRLAAALARVPRLPRDRPGLAAHVGRVLAWIYLGALASSFLRFPPDYFPGRIREGLSLCANAPPASWLILPFRAMLQPALAQTPLELLAALPVPLAILAAYYVWIVHGGVVFEESALVASEARQKSAEVFQRTGRRAGPLKGVKAPFRLAPTGNRMTALAWKNYLAISRRRPGIVVFVVAFLLGATAVLARIPEAAKAAEMVGMIAGIFALIATYNLPSLLRADLRSSLRSADLLKSLPMPGWAICLGEMISPVLVTFAVQATLLAMAAIAFPGVNLAWRVPAWIALVIILLPVDLLLFAIANGLALCFPAIMPLGPRVGRGGEQFGLNILLQLFRYLLLAVGLIPCALVGGIAAFLLYRLLGPWGLPIAAVLGAAVLAAEDGLIIWLLGGVLERFDPSKELN